MIAILLLLLGLYSLSGGESRIQTQYNLVSASDWIDGYSLGQSGSHGYGGVGDSPRFLGILASAAATEEPTAESFIESQTVVPSSSPGAPAGDVGVSRDKTSSKESADSVRIENKKKPDDSSSESEPTRTEKRKRVRMTKPVSKGLASSLPWQFNAALKLVGRNAARELDEEDEKEQMKLEKTQRKYEDRYKMKEKTKRFFQKIESHPFIKDTWNFAVALRLKLQAWALEHKGTFRLAGKTFLFSIVAVAILKRIGKWYKSMADYEILLDRTDYGYQSYGCNLNNAANALLSSINQTAIVEYQHQVLFQKLTTSLENPCFPHMMNDYAVQTGREIALLLEDLDARLRTKSKEFKHSSNPSDRGGSGSSVTEDFKYGNLMSDGSVSVQEGLVVYGIQKGVAVLQARQADACLRIARLQVLAGTNMCEDLLEVWRGRVASKSQTMRLPLPRFLMSRLPGAKMSSSVRIQHILTKLRSSLDFSGLSSVSTSKGGSERERDRAFGVGVGLEEGSKLNSVDLQGLTPATIDNALRDLSAREKVLLLENIQTGLYEAAGQIQRHLERLDSISQQLTSHLQATTAGPGLGMINTDLREKKDNNNNNNNGNNNNSNNNRTADKHQQIDLLGNSHWNELDNWVMDASVMCTKSLSAVTMNSRLTNNQHMTGYMSPAAGQAEEGEEGGGGGGGTEQEMADSPPSPNFSDPSYVDRSYVDSNSDNRNDSRDRDTKGNDDYIRNSKVGQNLTRFQRTGRSDKSEQDQPRIRRDLRAYQLDHFPEMNPTGWADLCIKSTRDYDAEAQGSIKLASYVVDGSVSDYIEKCMLRSDGYSLALEANGENLEHVSSWRALPDALFASALRREATKAETAENKETAASKQTQTSTSTSTSSSTSRGSTITRIDVRDSQLLEEVGKRFNQDVTIFTAFINDNHVANTNTDKANKENNSQSTDAYSGLGTEEKEKLLNNLWVRSVQINNTQLPSSSSSSRSFRGGQSKYTKEHAAAHAVHILNTGGLVHDPINDETVGTATFISYIVEDDNTNANQNHNQNHNHNHRRAYLTRWTFKDVVETEGGVDGPAPGETDKDKLGGEGEGGMSDIPRNLNSVRRRCSVTVTLETLIGERDPADKSDKSNESNKSDGSIGAKGGGDKDRSAGGSSTSESDAGISASASASSKKDSDAATSISAFTRSITRDSTMFVEQWKRLTKNIMRNGGSFAEQHKQLPQTSINILNAIGRDTIAEIEEAQYYDDVYDENDQNIYMYVMRIVMFMFR